MKKILLACIIALFKISFVTADSFTDLLQDLAIQTACLGKYSSAEAGLDSRDPYDYYTPSLMAQRFAEMSGERTRTLTFYGICFDYANWAYRTIEKSRILYNGEGMLENQFWLAVCSSDSGSIELSNPVSAEEGIRIWNGVNVKTYGSNSYINIQTHGNATRHAWLWVQRYDGVWFWIDPTWTDNCGYVVYGYIGNGKEIQCRPNKDLCLEYPYELYSLPEPPKAGQPVNIRNRNSKTPNTNNYRDPVLLDEKCSIKDNQCLYWKFTVPKDCNSIEIDSSSDAILHSVMTYVVVQSEADVRKFEKFCNGKEEKIYFIKGSFERNAKSYHVTLTGLTPGQTYYFCAFKEFALLSRFQYEIKTTIRTW